MMFYSTTRRNLASPPVDYIHTNIKATRERKRLLDHRQDRLYQHASSSQSHGAQRPSHHPLITPNPLLLALDARLLLLLLLLTSYSIPDEGQFEDWPAADTHKQISKMRLLKRTPTLLVNTYSEQQAHTAPTARCP